MTAVDTVADLAHEFGWIAGRKDADNEAAVYNIACWLRSAITSRAIVFTPLGDRMHVAIDDGSWTWPASWPHERLRAWVERERCVR